MEFFGKTDAPFKKIVFARIETLAVGVVHQNAQVDVWILGFIFLFGFVVQGEDVLMVGKLFGGEIAGGIQDGLRRCSGRHGQDNIEGFAVFAVFGYVEFFPVIQLRFDGFLSI